MCTRIVIVDHEKVISNYDKICCENREYRDMMKNSHDVFCEKSVEEYEQLLECCT